jgi:type IV pilus assembly protein PilA
MKTKYGFTLVETSVAVAVIGLLSALAIPTFRSVRTKSLNITKRANIRMLNNAVEMWAMDNFVRDEMTVDAAVTNYIKGGIDSLRVGVFHVNITNITQQTADHVFTIEDLY